MHDRWRDEFEDALADMRDSEKAELIARIARSMQRPARAPNLPAPHEVAARLAEIAALPEEGDCDGFSGRDHDSVLYGSPRGPGQ
jgi:hypothetical protein